MRIGLNSHVIKEFSGRGIPAKEAGLIELGFDDVQVLTSEGINWEILYELTTLDCDYTVHSPTSDGKNVSVDLGVKSRKNVRIMENVFRIAHVLDAKIVVIHGGDINGNYHRAFVNTREQMFELSRIAGEYGLTLVVENLQDNRIGAFLHELVPLMGENIGFCLDIGHAFLMSVKYGVPFESYLASRPVHVHLHDNLGRNDDHLIPGKGIIPMEKVLTAIRHMNPRHVVLEIGSYGSVEEIRNAINMIKTNVKGIPLQRVR